VAATRSLARLALSTGRRSTLSRGSCAMAQPGKGHSSWPRTRIGTSRRLR
jgi:hypothetical protein